MEQSWWEKAEFDRGVEKGSEPRTAASEAAEIVLGFVKSDAYTAGVEKGQEDRADSAR